MAKPPQGEQAVLMLLRDIESRRLPQALELLAQVQAGQRFTDEAQALLADLLGAAARVERLACQGLEFPVDATRLRECARRVSEDVIAAALASANANALESAPATAISSSRAAATLTRSE